MIRIYPVHKLLNHMLYRAQRRINALFGDRAGDHIRGQIRRPAGPRQTRDRATALRFHLTNNLFRRLVRSREPRLRGHGGPRDPSEGRMTRPLVPTLAALPGRPREKVKLRSALQDYVLQRIWEASTRMIRSRSWYQISAKLVGQIRDPKLRIEQGLRRRNR